MGFFSWKTSDTGESIASSHSNRPTKPVYLLQPNGKAPICELDYEGYGVFGGVNVYEWLAEVNFGNKSLVNVAISADCGKYYVDDNAVYLCAVHLSEAEFRQVVKTDKKVVVFETYAALLPNGMTPNQCIEAGLWREAQIPLTYPLKFSFDPNARYEDLPAAESCEYQGFFYPDEDEDDA